MELPPTDMAAWEVYAKTGAGPLPASIAIHESDPRTTTTETKLATPTLAEPVTESLEAGESAGHVWLAVAAVAAAAAVAVAAPGWWWWSPPPPLPDPPPDPPPELLAEPLFLARTLESRVASRTKGLPAGRVDTVTHDAS